MGTVYKKPSKRSKTGYRWYVSVTYQGQRYKEVAGDTKQAAQALLRKLENRLAKIGELAPRRVSFEFLSDEYLRWGNVNLATRTLRERKIIITAHLKPFFTCLIQDIDEPMIENYKRIRMESGISPHTMNNDLKVLSCLLTHGKAMKFFDPEHELPKIRRVKARNKEQRHLEEGQITLVLEQSKRPRTRAMLQLLIFSGLRKGEVLHLEWSQIDFERKLIHVKSRAEWEVKTANAIRTIPMTKQAEEALRMAWELRAEGEALVFPGRSGKPMQDIRACLNGACDRAGIPRVHIHGLRHTFGTLLAQAGADPKAIMNVMGHADLRTTMGYIATAQSHLRDQIAKLNRIPVPEEKNSKRPKFVPNPQKTRKRDSGQQPESP